jgi:hypothetical protein
MVQSASIDFKVEVDMISESWENWDFIDWGNGLGILTLPWIEPFLIAMGVPSKIASDPEVWADLYAQVRLQYCSLGKLANHQKILEQEHLLLQLAFENLGERTDLETVHSLFRWFNRHFRNERLNLALRQWQHILTTAIWPPDRWRTEICHPTFLEPLISELVWFEAERVRLALLQMPITFLIPAEDPDIIEMRRILVEKRGEHNGTEVLEEDLHGDANTVNCVITKELIIKAIKLINRSPNRLEIMSWLNEITERVDIYTLEVSDIEILQLYSGQTMGWCEM